MRMTPKICGLIRPGNVERIIVIVSHMSVFSRYISKNNLVLIFYIWSSIIIYDYLEGRNGMH